MTSHAPCRQWIAVMSAVLVATLSAQAEEADAGTKRIQLSEKVSSAIADGIKFQPATPAGPAPPAQQAEPPRNTIIRLPEHVVQAERPRQFTEREVHQPEDALKLARRRYLGHFHQNVLNKYRLFGSDDVYALQRLAEDERLANISHFDDKLYLLRISGNEAEARQLQREMRSTFARHSGL